MNPEGNGIESQSISNVSLLSDRLHIDWKDGTSNEFHYIWLRDNCPTARHPVLGEGTLDPCSIPLDIVPSEVQLTDNGTLQVVWNNDNHQSHYAPSWLYQNTYEWESRKIRNFQPNLWTVEKLKEFFPEVSYESIMKDDEGLRHWLQLLRDYGFTLVREVPLEKKKVLEIAQRIAFLRNSNFGTLFDVESKPDPNSLAYTSEKLYAHTDLVSREAQPGIQFLHCLVFEAKGGESILVDGFSAAEALRQQSPDDYQCLTTIPVRFRYQDKETDIDFKSPMIRLDADGNYFEIRYSAALLAPLDIAPDLIKPFYKAYQTFSRILRSPQFEYHYKLKPGNCAVFNNRRILHGRSEFFPQSGARHFQGCYVDTDDFLSRLRVLERNGKDFRESLSIIR